VPFDRLLVVAALACAAATDATAGDVSYLRRGQDPDTAVVVDSNHRTREIRRGEELAGAGRLEEIDDEEIILERALSDAERAELQRLGLAAPDVRRLHLRRRDPDRGAASLGAGANLFSAD
jgi:hypothetical protein